MEKTEEFKEQATLRTTDRFFSVGLLEPQTTNAYCRLKFGFNGEIEFRQKNVLNFASARFKAFSSNIFVQLVQLLNSTNLFKSCLVLKQTFLLMDLHVLALCTIFSSNKYERMPHVMHNIFHSIVQRTFMDARAFSPS